MIIRDLIFENGSTEATKIKKILQRNVIYISDQITVPI
jgi:ribosome-associated protein YbcJ (S4-like RNA binding protein)